MAARGRFAAFAVGSSLGFRLRFFMGFRLGVLVVARLVVGSQCAKGFCGEVPVPGFSCLVGWGLGALRQVGSACAEIRFFFAGGVGLRGGQAVSACVDPKPRTRAFPVPTFA